MITNGLGFKSNSWNTHLEGEDALVHRIFISEDMIRPANIFFFGKAWDSASSDQNAPGNYHEVYDMAFGVRNRSNLQIQ